MWTGVQMGAGLIWGGVLGWELCGIPFPIWHPSPIWYPISLSDTHTLSDVPSPIPLSGTPFKIGVPPGETGWHEATLMSHQSGILHSFIFFTSGVTYLVTAMSVWWVTCLCVNSQKFENFIGSHKFHNENMFQTILSNFEFLTPPSPHYQIRKWENTRYVLT